MRLFLVRRCPAIDGLTPINWFEFWMSKMYISRLVLYVAQLHGRSRGEGEGAIFTEYFTRAHFRNSFVPLVRDAYSMKYRTVAAAMRWWERTLTYFVSKYNV